MLSVLGAELAVLLPAQRVEFGLGLLRVVADHRAVVLVALLAGDEDVVAQRRRVLHQAALADVDDRLPVDALGDRLAQRLVGQDRAGCPVEGQVIPAGSGSAADRDPLGARGDGQFVQGGDTGGVDGVVLQGRDARGVVKGQEGDRVQQRRGAPPLRVAGQGDPLGGAVHRRNHERAGRRTRPGQLPLVERLRVGGHGLG